jgi:hypothetical protein
MNRIKKCKGFQQSKHYFLRAHMSSEISGGFKGIGSILFLKNGLKTICRKTIKITSEVIIMRYVQM